MARLSLDCSTTRLGCLVVVLNLFCILSWVDCVWLSELHCMSSSLVAFACGQFTSSSIDKWESASNNSYENLRLHVVKRLQPFVATRAAPSKMHCRGIGLEILKCTFTFSNLPIVSCNIQITVTLDLLKFINCFMQYCNILIFINKIKLKYTSRLYS